MTETERKTCTITEAAVLARVSKRTVYHWLRRGILHARETPSGKTRIYVDELHRQHPKWGHPTLGERMTGIRTDGGSPEHALAELEAEDVATEAAWQRAASDEDREEDPS